MRTFPFYPAFLTGLALCVSGCSKKEEQAAPPPTAVQVETVKSEQLPRIIELPGRIEAVRTAEVRPRADGIIQKRLFEEGTFVQEGAPLFLIDPRDYQAQLQSAKATLEGAIASQTNAASLARRYKPLVERRAISGQEFDTAQSDLLQANAQVSEARAALARAELLLSYTTLRAPISGRVGRAQFTEGALVSASQADPLVRIDQMTPVHAVFTIASAELLDASQQAQKGDLTLPDMANVTVELLLENGTAYGSKGRLNFADAIVAPDTGTQAVRASFDNEAGQLKPGEFVHGRFQAGTVANGIAVPARAVQIRSEQASVSLLSKDGVVASREIELGELLGERWIVRSGLKPGDQVIVEGWQKVRPGQPAQAKKNVPAAPSNPAQPRPSPGTAQPTKDA